ncbi:hypothetical protein MG290_14740 (plasmid) [Flavobacterium sp. CBA20B-1]|uniref:hypothetical protein n=1 Tax=unclassified Flavobacterium TaxID=196869 RepID=UPI00222527A9|nr:MULTISPECIES: hypothetical protein [unclassified Flavobacterium]WCM43619.1 hypothetical protein MG290_14740 [Flavobacterium sp. CBA20B-1]
MKKREGKELSLRAKTVAELLKENTGTFRQSKPLGLMGSVNKTDEKFSKIIEEINEGLELPRSSSMKVFENQITKSNIGLVVTAEEHKMIYVLSKLLADKSKNIHNKDDRESFYTGEGVILNSEFNTGNKHPFFNTSFFEIAKIYHSDNAPGGRQQEMVRNIIKRLKDKSMYLEYQYQNPHNNKVRKGWRYTSLISSIGNEVDIDSYLSTSSFQITLDPIFRIGIGESYISHPNNIIEQFNAVGRGKKTKGSFYAIHDYIKRQKYKEIKVSEYVLFNVMNHEFYEKSQKSVLKKQLQEAVDRLIELDIIYKFKVETKTKNKKGVNYIFYKK